MTSNSTYIIAGTASICLVVAFGIFIVWIYSPVAQIGDETVTTVEVDNKTIKDHTPQEKIKLLDELLPEQTAETKTSEEIQVEINLLDKLKTQGSEREFRDTGKNLETNTDEDAQLRLLEQLRTE